MYWYIAALKKYAVFRWRARRKEFCYFTLFSCLIFIALGTVDGVIGAHSPRYPDHLFSLVYLLAVVIPSYAVVARRLHDTNRSDWWLLALLIPGLNLYVWVSLFVRNGHPGKNRFGPDPTVDTDFGGPQREAVASGPARLGSGAGR